MNRTIKISALLLFVTAFFASCVGDSDNEITYYSDAAIISFSVTNFNTYHTTTASNGSDSIYKKKEDGKKYKFYIDQTRREIYNPDSLPVGTDARHLICAISTARGGTLYIKSATSDSITYLSLTDSLDFTKERVVKVISQDGLYERTYSVKVNVHKQLADDFHWNFAGSNSAFANADDIKLLSKEGNLAAFVQKSGKIEIYATAASLPDKWKKSDTVFESGDNINAIVSDDRYLIMTGGKIYSSADALSWTELADASSANILRLAGSNAETVYAVTPEGLIKSEDACRTWSADQMADSNILLPNKDISFVVQPLVTNPDVKRMVLVGNTAALGYAAVWSRLSDRAADENIWNFVEPSYDEKCRLPKLEGLEVIPYSGGLYAMGAERLNDGQKAYRHIYFSRDGGITWLDDSRFKLPEGFSCTKGFALTSDYSNNIWIICGDSGYIWRGRLNGLAWENK